MGKATVDMLAMAQQVEMIGLYASVAFFFVVYYRYRQRFLQLNHQEVITDSKQFTDQAAAFNQVAKINWWWFAAYLVVRTILFVLGTFLNNMQVTADNAMMMALIGYAYMVLSLVYPIVFLVFVWRKSLKIYRATKAL
ncbi:MAG: hypothetical protein ABF743_00190 [Schleiferilactobacillus perolens]|jgi:hypothetical protein|uniref:Integral membrane protein n=1 Tax=Schleiferilactobacillus perolens DSM 12744 TaxID=1423792 RepID=A0A0R1MUX9_9LACO|nr:hypothetical protein [Schleiferilactobacillus perolens]KRL11369.1 hypothetical protein FD09_GL000739 [Schleiferilactobacillus perolens DSM 12744]